MSQHNSFSAAVLTTSAPKFRRLISGNHTNIAEFSNHDTQSAPTVDRLSTARASVAISDKLWSQIDVLDDVKAMAEKVDSTGGFFTEEFSDSLARLKNSQSRLIEMISKHQTQSDRAREQRHEQAKEHLEVVSVHEDEIHDYQERTRKRMSEFFSGAAKPLLETAHLRDFDELNEYVLEVRDSLSDVSEKMTSFDQVTKRLW